MSKLNIEVQKKNKTTNKIEWTETLEISYENEKQVFTEQEKEQQKNMVENKVIHQENKTSDELINTKIMSMKKNPFHQPTMNTLEFENDDNIITVNITKDNEVWNIKENEKLLALEKLYHENIISKDEFEEKKNKIILGK